MSCPSCGDNTNNTDCNPCAPALTTQESLASQIQNLTLALLGEFTKTIVNGRAVWGAQCSPNDAGLACFPRADDEGWVCYILRILDEIGLFNSGEWDVGTEYCKNSFVTYNNIGYISIQASPAGTLPTDTDYWLVFVEPVTGPAGPQGIPGASGGGSAINYAQRTVSSIVTLDANDAVVFCEPAGAFPLTLPEISTLDNGKWYTIWTDGAFAVTVTPTGADTINGAASYVLNTANEAITLVSNNAGKWRIV